MTSSRPVGLVLALAAQPAIAAVPTSTPPSPPPLVDAWNCTAYPYPIQILKRGTDPYWTLQLNLVEGDFVEMWQWTTNTDEHPTAQLNAQAYNEIDGIAYGLFSASDSFEPEGVTAYLCRFSDSQNSAVCLCEAPRMGNAAAITADGNYYLGYKGGVEIHMLPAVHSIPSGWAN